MLFLRLDLLLLIIVEGQHLLLMVMILLICVIFVGSIKLMLMNLFAAIHTLLNNNKSIYEL